MLFSLKMEAWHLPRRQKVAGVEQAVLGRTTRHNSAPTASGSNVSRLVNLAASQLPSELYLAQEVAMPLPFTRIWRRASRQAALTITSTLANSMSQQKASGLHACADTLVQNCTAGLPSWSVVALTDIEDNHQGWLFLDCTHSCVLTSVGGEGSGGLGRRAGGLTFGAMGPDEGGKVGLGGDRA